MRVSYDSPYIDLYKKSSINSRESINRSNSHSNRLPSQSFLKAPIYLRSSNKILSNDPITGFQKKFESYRSLSPLGAKNLKVSEKVNNSLYSSEDYSFYRQTKNNPKYHSLNPITGEHSHRQISKSYIPEIYQKIAYIPQPYKPVRIYKGLGYKKSEVFP